MHLVGQRRLPVGRERAWSALNDPEILRAAIPGCESIEKSGDDEYVVIMLSALGPVKARFRGRLKLENVVALESYTMRFEGEGAAAGYAKGAADVTLTGKAPVWLYLRIAHALHGRARILMRLDHLARNDRDLRAIEIGIVRDTSSAERWPRTPACRRRSPASPRRAR